LSFASISSVPAAMAWRTLFLSANADGLMLGDDAGGKIGQRIAGLDCGDGVRNIIGLLRAAVGLYGGHAYPFP